MTTTAASLNQTISSPEMYGFTVRFMSDADGTGWDVLDPDSDVLDTCETRAAAVKSAKALGRDRRLETLRDKIGDLVAECGSIAKLEAALALLK